MNVQHRIKNIFKNSDEVASDKIAKRVYFDVHSVSDTDHADFWYACHCYHYPYSKSR